MSDFDTPIWEVFVPVAISYRIADHEASDAAETAELVDGEADFEASPWSDADRTDNVYGPWKPEPDEDIDDSFEWQRDAKLDIRAVGDVARAFKALNGLTKLHHDHGLDQPGPATTSAGDQCNDLYALLEALGLPVT